jgi:hypothetical protein
MAMLADFVTNQDIDVLLFARGVDQHSSQFSWICHTSQHRKEWEGYGHHNVRQTRATRYITIAIREEMTPNIEGIRLVNIYAPSGAGKRQEREEVFYAFTMHASMIFYRVPMGEETGLKR